MDLRDRPALEKLFSSTRNVQQISPPAAVLSWCPPPPGQYKLNSDAAVFGEEFGLGAVCRDSDGRIRFDAGCRVYGNGDVVLAEALACRWGVQLAPRLGFHDLIVEVDSAIVSQKLSKHNYNCGLVDSVVNDIHILGRTCNTVAFSLVRKSANTSPLYC